MRLNGFLGKEPKADKPKQALFWRSGKTVDALAGNLAGMKALFEASQLGDALPADHALDRAVDRCSSSPTPAHAAAAADGPIADVLADPGQARQARLFRLVTSSLSELFGTRLSGALGLTAGFSSLDGD